MELQEGMKVKLVSWKEVDTGNPGVNGEMKDYFGKVVTIERFATPYPDYLEDKLFYIKEDNCVNMYAERWVICRYYLPDELFKI